MRSRYGKKKRKGKRFPGETKVDMDFDPALKQPILNQIYNSWDIHGDERRIRVKDKITKHNHENK